MSEESFWELHNLLYPFMKRPKSDQKKHCNGAKNGLITVAIRLSSALRYFAGGRPEDVSLVHGISHTEVFNSVWQVVDAVNTCPALDFCFPETHES